MLREDPGFYLTNLHSWINGNSFFGSFRTMRFLVKPTVVKDKATDTLKPESKVETFVWKGEYCMEESEILAEAVFPLTEEGREQVLEWLEEKYKWITT